MNTENIISIVRTVNLIMSMVFIVVWLRVYIKTRDLSTLACLLWGVNVFCFYIYRFWILYNPFEGSQFLLNMWVSILILHALVLNVIFGILFKKRKE